MRIESIQKHLVQSGLDGWLFFDHHQRDPLAYRVLSFQPPRSVTRRWYYFIPAQGEPRKLVHRIEAQMLDALPGESTAYASWKTHLSELKKILKGTKKIAMQYSPQCAIPYVSMVDAGTIEMIRSFDIEIVSSADLIQVFEAVWTDQQLEQHQRAGKKIDLIRKAAFEKIRAMLNEGTQVNEFMIKNFILESFDRENLFTDHGPIVGVNGNASDPHYEPFESKNANIAEGDVVLIDLWAKCKESGAVYYDVTWTGYVGTSIPESIQNVFQVVAGARDAAVQEIQRRICAGESIRGCDVDDVTRGFISQRGYGEYFFHRTGHSIGEDVHGTGANMDNLETHDERMIIPKTCFSIEPGIYMPDFGIRSEVNVYVGDDRAMVTGEIQRELVQV